MSPLDPKARPFAGLSSVAQALPTDSTAAHVSTGLQLPEMALPKSYADAGKLLMLQASPCAFSAELIAAAIQHECEASSLQYYLESYNDDAWQKKQILLLVKRHYPLLFFAIERNYVKCVRLLLEHGVDPNCRSFPGYIPALAFAIRRAKEIVSDTTDVVKELLAFGADPRVVPEDMWSDYLETPTAIPKDPSEMNPVNVWCKPALRTDLFETLHLTQRYLLFRASRLPPIKPRVTQIAKAHGMTDLLKIPYFIIGQAPAVFLIMRKVMAHIAFNTKEPLVMSFSGPSGHGKTEMARQMGSLLSVKTTVVDCGQMKHDWDMFGSRNGYVGNEKGSQLNNFLAAQDGKRSVVFLDEFDKTTQEIRDALLLLLDSGDYYDRRANTKVDASQTIWILATNFGDKAIERFFDEHIAWRDSIDSLNEIPLPTLEVTMKKHFTARFGAPLTGRINLIAPFFPFTPPERAVVAHKFILSLARALRRPLDLSPLVKRYVAHAHLSPHDSDKAAVAIAAASYHPETGARSLYHAVNNVVRDGLFDAYCEEEALVEEKSNEGPLARFRIGVKGADVAVVRDGVTEVVERKRVQQQQARAVDTRLDGFRSRPIYVDSPSDGNSDDDEDSTL